MNIYIVVALTIGKSDDKPGIYINYIVDRKGSHSTKYENN